MGSSFSAIVPLKLRTSTPLRLRLRARLSKAVSCLRVVLGLRMVVMTQLDSWVKLAGGYPIGWLPGKRSRFASV